MIKPTVGRVVWFYPAKDETPVPGFTYREGQPCKADIVYVHSDTRVNLMVVDHDGVPHSRTSVELIQEGTATPEGQHCAWMPFQVGQAKAQAPQSGSAV